MNIKSILAVTDFSAREDLAIQQACQLAGAHRASIKSMYVPAAGQPSHPSAAARLRQEHSGADLVVPESYLKASAPVTARRRSKAGSRAALQMRAVERRTA